MPEEKVNVRQVPCPSCGGQGRTIISRDMAIDAGDRSMEGIEWGCSHCNGDGWILKEIEPEGEICQKKK